MPISIRRIESKDLPDLAKAFADAYRPENTGENWTVDKALEVVKYWHLRAPHDLQILAEADNKIIGAIFVDVKPWWNGCRLVDGEFFVLTNYQTQGAGTRLLKEAVKTAEEKYNCTSFETITFMPEESHPLQWYKKLGLKLISLWPSLMQI